MTTPSPAQPEDAPAWTHRSQTQLRSAGRSPTPPITHCGSLPPNTGSAQCCSTVPPEVSGATPVTVVADAPLSARASGSCPASRPIDHAPRRRPSASDRFAQTPIPTAQPRPCSGDDALQFLLLRSCNQDITAARSAKECGCSYAYHPGPGKPRTPNGAAICHCASAPSRCILDLHLENSGGRCYAKV